MPPKPPLPSLFGNTGFVCQSCLFRLRRISRPPSWGKCHYSRLRGPALAAQRRQLKDDLERLPRPAGEAEALQSDDKPVIRYYQQEAPGQLRRLEDADEFSKEFNANGDREMAARINELEAKLKDATRLMDLIESSHGVEAGEEGKTELVRITARGRLSRLGKEDIDGGTSSSTLPLVAVDEFTKVQRPPIRAINNCLTWADRNGALDHETVTRVWRFYSAARKSLSSNWQAVPPEVWDFLWHILGAEVSGVDNRMHHVYVLATDMQSAGVMLDGERKLLAIEAMFVEGWETEAMDNWKRLVASLGTASTAATTTTTVVEYWALGVRMCCLAGDLERAERAADRLFEAVPDADPRVLIPLIRAFARTEDGALERAWENYRRLRDRLGASMTIEDYDEVISCFLQANQTEHALHVFVDMMFSGQVDLDKTTRLPGKVANQFFLGKWLKRLIGNGDLDGAFSVLKYMEGHHVIAASIQVNGLIGAWMRSGTADNQQKAEDLAWAMIRSRQMYVDLRKRQRAMEWPMALQMPSVKTTMRQTKDARQDSASGAVLRIVPRANTETFSLLAENYRSRGLHDRLKELWAAMREAEVSSDTFLANQLIRSYNQQGLAQKARDFYTQVMVEDKSIKPDADTFLELFRPMRTTERDRAKTVPPCRGIFRDMVLAPWVFASARTVEWLPKMVLHAFRDAGDAVGALVALRAMQPLFGFAPSEPLLLEMALTSVRRRGTGPAAESRRLLAAHTQIERLLKERLDERRALGADGGGALPTLTAEQKAEELALVLERLLWTACGAETAMSEADEDDFGAVFAAAAEEMGVYDVVVEEDAGAVARKKKTPTARR